MRLLVGERGDGEDPAGERLHGQVTGKFGRSKEAADGSTAALQRPQAFILVGVAAVVAAADVQLLLVLVLLPLLFSLSQLDLVEGLEGGHTADQNRVEVDAKQLPLLLVREAGVNAVEGSLDGRQVAATAAAADRVGRQLEHEIRYS